MYARPYIVYKYKTRNPNNKPKNIYTKRRYKKLHRYASKKLDRILANNESLSKNFRDQVKKQIQVADDNLEISRAPKRTKTTFDDINEVTNKNILSMNPPCMSYCYILISIIKIYRTS
jgi:hypothetical protein